MRTALRYVMWTVMSCGCSSALPTAGPFGAPTLAGAPATSVPAASGGAGASPTSAVAPAAVGGCPARFTLATRASMDMSWPDTIGYLGGKSKLHAWTKITHTLSEAGSTWQATPCGVSLPIVTTSPLLDGVELSNEIPVAAFDLPSMPRTTGRATWTNGTYALETVTVLGATLSDAQAAWPVRKALVPADHDGDGKIGVTAIPKQGGVFGLPPTDIGQIDHADQIYIASRISLRLSAPASSCSAPSDGNVEPVGFDYTIIGCHALGRDDCKEEEVNLLSNNSPTFMLGAHGTWSSRPVAETASCAEVVAALPAQ